MNNQDIKNIVDQVMKIIYTQVDTILKYMSTIKFGSENNVLQIDKKNGLWAGNADPTLAPFKISLAGVVTSGASTSTPTLLNSWVHYGAPYATPSYHKTADGTVVLNGFVKSGSSGVVFTLPVGYRPSSQLIFTVVSNGVFGRVDVGTDGNVTGIVYSNVSLSLDGINFRV